MSFGQYKKKQYLCTRFEINTIYFSLLGVAISPKNRIFFYTKRVTYASTYHKHARKHKHIVGRMSTDPEG